MRVICSLLYLPCIWMMASTQEVLCNFIEYKISLPRDNYHYNFGIVPSWVFLPVYVFCCYEIVHSVSRT